MGTEQLYKGREPGFFAWFYSLLESGSNREIAHPPKGLITCSTLVGGATDKVEVGPGRLKSVRDASYLYSLSFRQTGFSEIQLVLCSVGRTTGSMGYTGLTAA